MGTTTNTTLFFVASPKFQHCLNEKWGKSYIRDYKQIIYVQISTFWNISPAIGHPYRHRCPSRRKTCPGPFASRPRRHPLCQPKYQHLRTVSSEKGKPIPTDRTYWLICCIVRLRIIGCVFGNIIATEMFGRHVHNDEQFCTNLFVEYLMSILALLVLYLCHPLWDWQIPLEILWCFTTPCGVAVSPGVGKLVSPKNAGSQDQTGRCPGFQPFFFVVGDW